MKLGLIALLNEVLVFFGTSLFEVIGKLYNTKRPCQKI